MYSLYFNDSHLNKFEPRQTYHVLDSLKKAYGADTDMVASNKDDYSSYMVAMTSNSKPFTHAEAQEWFKYFQTDMHYDTTNMAIKSAFKTFLKLSDSSNTVLQDKLISISKIADTVQLRKQLQLELKNIKNPTIYKKINEALAKNNQVQLRTGVVATANWIETRFTTLIFNEAEKLYGKVSENMAAVRDSDKAKIDVYAYKWFEYNLYFYLLLITGAFLFVFGSISWYFKIQKPQDQILKAQLADATQKGAVKEFKARKHFEPQTLPRPQARNLK